jgi:hypothetical protein
MKISISIDDASPAEVLRMLSALGANDAVITKQDKVPTAKDILREEAKAEKKAEPKQEKKQAKKPEPEPEVDDDEDSDSGNGHSDVPAEILNAGRLREVLEALVKQGAKDEDELIEKCLALKAKVPVLRRIEGNFEERVRRTASLFF